MTTGIAFMKWTEQGAHAYKETVDRLEPALALGKKFDVEVRQTYWTPGGPYDLVGVAEGPDYKSLAGYCLALQSLGFLDISWAEAFSPDEMRELVALGN